MSNREQSCEERIVEEMASRENDLRDLYAIADMVDESGTFEGYEIDAEEAYDRIAELPLGVSTYVTMRVDLSTGGPADFLEVRLAKETHGFSVERVTYHFADWFDHAEREVEQDSPFWRFAEHYAECIDTESVGSWKQ